MKTPTENWVQTRWSGQWVFPLGVMLLAWGIDSSEGFLPGISVAPLLLVLGLFILALKVSPSRLAAWSMVFWFFLLYSLASVPSFDWQNEEARARLFVRLGSFAVGAAIAFNLARTRLRLARHSAETLEVLVSLPIPVVVADAAGYVQFVNQAAERLLGARAGERFVEVVMSDVDEGKAMRFYIEFFEERPDQADVVQVRPRGLGQAAQARMICLGHGKDRRLVAVLQDGVKENEK